MTRITTARRVVDSAVGLNDVRPYAIVLKELAEKLPHLKRS